MMAPNAPATAFSFVRVARARAGVLLFALTAPLALIGCSCDGTNGGGDERDGALPEGPGPRVGQVWLAQTHVQAIDGQPELQFAEDALNAHLGTSEEPLLRLVGGRDVLLKVDLTSRDAVAAPPVTARVLDGAGAERWSGVLEGPDTLPTSLSDAPGEVEHDLATSFAVLIPGEHVRPEMQIEVVVEAGADSFSRTWTVAVGAPTVLPVLMFDFDYFATRGDRVLSDEVVEELALKLPVRELAVQRIDTPFSTATFLPQRQTVDGVEYATPHIRASSFEDWAAQAEAATGVAFQPRNERSVDHTHTLLGALQSAGGQQYVAALHGNFTDGTRGSFKGRGGSNMLSSSTSSNVLNARNVMVHEFSHSMDLWHWHEQSDGDYPYRDAMFGIGAEGANGVHCGPTWRYRSPEFGDGPLGAFVAPTVEASGGARRYRRVISTSGARDDRAIEFEELFGTYSDWDVRVTQRWLENQLRVWNPSLESWARWDASTGDYTRVVGGVPGLDLPLAAEPVEVLSILVAVSAVTPEANLVYDPVGPYQSGLLRRFDPTVPSEVTEAAALEGYCPEEGCDYALRVTRGGAVATYLLRAGDADVAPTDDAAVRHTAINLPTSEGTPTRLELLSTPDAQRVGAPSTPTVLYTWTP